MGLFRVSLECSEIGAELLYCLVGISPECRLLFLIFAKIFSLQRYELISWQTRGYALHAQSWRSSDWWQWTVAMAVIIIGAKGRQTTYMMKKLPSNRGMHFLLGSNSPVVSSEPLRIAYTLKMPLQWSSCASLEASMQHRGKYKVLLKVSRGLSCGIAYMSTTLSTRVPWASNRGCCVPQVHNPELQLSLLTARTSSFTDRLRRPCKFLSRSCFLHCRGATRNFYAASAHTNASRSKSTEANGAVTRCHQHFET